MSAPSWGLSSSPELCPSQGQLFPQIREDVRAIDPIPQLCPDRCKGQSPASAVGLRKRAKDNPVSLKGAGCERDGGNQGAVK